MAVMAVREVLALSLDLIAVVVSRSLGTSVVSFVVSPEWYFRFVLLTFPFV